MPSLLIARLDDGLIVTGLCCAVVPEVEMIEVELLVAAVGAGRREAIMTPMAILVTDADALFP